MIPLVFAVNRINENSLTDVQADGQAGTATFLAKHFSGALIGLPPVSKGNTLRPAFSDVVVKEGDKVSHQSVNLWGSGYSSRGYREWKARGLIHMPASSEFQLLPPFITEFENQLQGFHFEELLVWMFAFSGFPDSVDSWDKLFRHFVDSEVAPNANFPPVYDSRFNVSNNVPWPTDQILNARPTDQEFQQALIPSEFAPPQADTQSFTDSTHLTEDELKTLIALIKDKGQLVLYGPPGTGKTFVARELALYLTGRDPERIELVQFHPSYGYEDFMIGLRPEVDEDSGQLTYEAVSGAFLRVAENAQQSDKLFVVIIDEINRGNLPRIFGELMYLLEYRKDQNDQGEANALSEATIPHREEPLSVPPNVFVIGTMNTSDRSIGQIDLALRRRFHFFPLGPNERVLKAVLDATASAATDTALKLFRNVNRRVRDEAHLEGDIIGHSFFMAPNLTEGLLRLRYQYSVVPMLEEIFYAQPEIIASHFDYDALLAEPAAQDTLQGNSLAAENARRISSGESDSAAT